VYSSAIEDFIAAARTYCAWLESAPGTDEDERMSALLHLTMLYTAALRLPSAEPEDSDPPEMPEAIRIAVRTRLASFPVQTYWMVFEPLSDLPEEPVCGLIPNDLEDTYADLKEGLLSFQTHPGTAIFNWRLLFNIHWGGHVTSAIRALHCFDPHVRSEP
jgi:Domain of unknown function (DUF5063)